MSEERRETNRYYTSVSPDTKRIVVRKADYTIKNSDLSAVSRYMDTQPYYDIAAQPWEDYKTNNKARFAIAYSDDNLLLKFEVKEQYLKSSSRPVNDHVNNDNCVEFFVSFGDTAYYNLELNCLGSVKLGYGAGRGERIMLSEEIIKKIKIQTVIAANINAESNYANWELTLVIPKEVFYFSSIDTFAGRQCRANFYKCGNELPDRHYLTWNKVRTERPDFHRPEFFGDLIFE